MLQTGPDKAARQSAQRQIAGKASRANTCFSLVSNGLGQLAGGGLSLADAEQGGVHQSCVGQEGRQVRAAGCSPPLAECTQATLLKAGLAAYIPWKS